jgi:hypothetical protein
MRSIVVPLELTVRLVRVGEGVENTSGLELIACCTCELKLRAGFMGLVFCIIFAKVQLYFLTGCFPWNALHSSSAVLEPVMSKPA